jgi:hypothetical protein
MAATKKVNYTPELTASIIEAYQAGEDVESIATRIEKSVRSVRSKLVREGVYIAVEKPKAKKVDGPTKKELLAKLAEVSPDAPLDGLMGATKEAIEYVIALATPAEAE